MSEMVDRVARAIMESEQRPIDVGELNMDYYRRSARAAIEAMRKPPRELYFSDLTAMNIPELWEKMIDRVLRETK